VPAGIVAVEIVDDCPTSAAVPIGATNSRWGIHHALLGRSTTGTTTASGSRHHLLSLFLIGLDNDLQYSLMVNSSTRQFIVGEVGRKTQMFLQVDGKSFTVEVSFLLICAMWYDPYWARVLNCLV
jgi:hypothetical protein